MNQEVIDHKVPEYLTDNIHTMDLRGHYYNPLPKDNSLVRKECNNRAVDVVNLATSIRDKNIELSAIRRLENS